MKSPGVVYRKYRQMLRKKLYFLVVENYKRDHGNCAYAHTVKYLDVNNRNRSSKMCLYAVLTDPKGENDSRKIDVCTCASECNAFAPAKSKEEVVKEFERDIKDYKTCLRKYPELAAFSWLLDKDLEDAKKNPNFLDKIVIYLINFLENLLKR
jgi:hypothetical protein